ncbi:MAG: glycosyltransferase family 39 protein, partial [Cyanobacteria bacterium J06623_7]
MSIHHRSIWRRSAKNLRQGDVWLEYLCLICLSLAALTLFLVNLSSLSLIDYQEATIASVAREIIASGHRIEWIFPTLWHEPYLDAPPLIHIMVAIAYKLGGINEFTTRFPGALLGALSVLLLYQIGREIFVARLPALFSALVYLTCLPVVRYSRLATLDGPLLFFQLIAVWAVLRSRRDLKWTVVTGMGFGLMSLTHSLFSLQFLLLILLFLFWDTPRLLSSVWFWGGLLIGAFPAVTWYTLFLWRHRALGFNAGWGQLLLNSAPSVSLESTSLGYYLLHSMQYFLPWLAITFAGIQLLKHNLHWGWGKLLAVWLGGYLILGLLLQRSDFWLVLPLYPALALATGKYLDYVRNLPSFIIYPRTSVY